MNALTSRCLAWQKKSLDQFAFAADGHAREPFAPRVVGHVWFRVEPCCQQLELCCRNLSISDAVEEMLE